MAFLTGAFSDFTYIKSKKLRETSKWRGDIWERTTWWQYHSTKASGSVPAHVQQQIRCYNPATTIRERDTKTQKWETPCFKRKRAHCTYVKEVKGRNKIDESLYEKLKPVGSQPPWLYGLAKVRKPNTPLRPVLSMPGSTAKQVSDWLSTVKECQINSSTQSINDNLKSISVENDEELVSFDIVSLYTNVPVHEAIHHCADLLYNNDNETCIERNLYWTSNHEQL